MRNQLALSGEKILEKIYPQLFHHVGMIRGEYLLRELNQNIILASCQQFVKDYLETICSLYSDEEVWYRFSELTNTEANCLVGTREFFDEGHPLLAIEEPGVYWRVWMNFRLKHMSLQKFIKPTPIYLLSFLLSMMTTN
ncbi:PEP-utilizing enzyme family protein [Streptococcus pneumoniae]|nr:PEP-utilizing enzyme family protein [Streptococcus pneumoniae]VTD19490.1 PEP-utilizing enzyme family protein [Streptococcus pneumoniae]